MVSLSALVYVARNPESGYLKLQHPLQQQQQCDCLSGETDKIYCMTAEWTGKRSWISSEWLARHSAV